jgi:hypothetical protein
MLTALRAFIVFCRYYESAAFPQLLLTGVSPDYLLHIPRAFMRSRSTLNSRPYPIAQHLMALFSRYTTSLASHTFTSPGSFTDFVNIVFFISAAAITVISYILLSLRRRIRAKTAMDLEHSREEKESTPKIPHKRNDSTLSQLEDPNKRLLAIQKELSRSSPKPIYPWTAPPTPLPGPYDAPYYPLPLPSIRAFIDGSTTTISEPSIKTEDTSLETNEIPEEIHITSYTRQLSADTTPNQNSPIIRGTTTTSNHGWVRTQWTVSKA